MLAARRTIAALVTAVTLAGCGGDDPPATATTGAGTTPGPATPAGTTAFPTEDMFPLESGTTYATTRFRPALRITIGHGDWTAATGDRPDHLSLERDVGRGDAFLAFHHFTKVFDPRKGGVKPGDMVPGPRDVVRWLQADPHVRTTKPVPVTLLGMQGVRLDMTVVSSQTRVPRDCEKVTSGTGPCVALFHDGFDFAVYAKDGGTRFWVLGEPGSQLVVEASASPRSAFPARVRMLERALRGVEIPG